MSGDNLLKRLFQINQFIRSSQWIWLGLVLSFLSAQNIETVLPCEKCHTTKNWSQPLDFDHTSTDFPLTGRHAMVSCAGCHTGESLGQRHRFEAADDHCLSCHIDFHDSRYGKDCEKCHRFDDWLSMKWRDLHDDTFFPLTGAHKRLDCEACHTVFGLVWDKPSIYCQNCHMGKYIEAQDQHSGYPANCRMCHNPYHWSPAQLGLHDSVFPIYSGKHRGQWTDCTTECHTNSSDYAVFNCGLNGVCHKHDRDKMDGKHGNKSGYHYESTSCYNCHPGGGE